MCNYDIVTQTNTVDRPSSSPPLQDALCSLNNLPSLSQYWPQYGDRSLPLSATGAAAGRDIRTTRTDQCWSHKSIAFLGENLPSTGRHIGETAAANRIRLKLIFIIVIGCVFLYQGTGSVTLSLISRCNVVEGGCLLTLD